MDAAFVFVFPGPAMGLFDRFKRRKPPPLPEPTGRPNLIVALSALIAPDEPAIKARLEGAEPLRLAPKLDFNVIEADVLHGHVEFDSHVIRVAGFNVPTPPAVMEKTVACSAWQGEALETLQGHKAHLILFHEQGGASAAERFIALYKLAAAMGGDALCGTIHESGWTCASAALVRGFLDADELKSLREALPPIVFFGVLPFHGDEGSWLATKGCHLFGVPDLVIERADASNSELFELLHGIFLYMLGGARLAAGHTMQAGEDLYLKFEHLPDDLPHRELLRGEGKTLLITRITKDDVPKS